MKKAYIRPQISIYEVKNETLMIELSTPKSGEGTGQQMSKRGFNEDSFDETNDKNIWE